ncbi:MAG: PASTA domain-containing protein [Bacteroidota bacterium]
MKLYAKSIKGLLIQILAFIAIGVGLVLFFFYVYLPGLTNHGEIVTVPNLEGVQFEELDEFLTKRNLRYTITEDSGYSEEHPPQVVLQQTPKAYSKVKENRKIYITLNRVSPPTVRMPCLVDGSIKNAQAVLKSYGLRLGEIKYKAALGVNSVLEQLYNDESYDCEDIEKGILIPKGSKIDLIAADGFGKKRLPVPDLIGKSLDEAEFTIIGSGLNLGAVIFQKENDEILVETNDSTGVSVEVRSYEIGEVLDQKPGVEQTIRIGQTIDLWVSGTREAYEEKLKQDSIAQAEGGALFYE